MGADATILIKVKDREEITSWLPSGFSINEADTFELGICPEATHCVDSGYKYYNKGYERGEWPSICSALIELFADRSIEKIWYGYEDNVKEITFDDVIDISRHYVKNKNKPFYS